MKVALFLLVIILGCHAWGNDVSERFYQFQMKFGKSYKSRAETNRRFAIFKENLKKIEEHNLRFENGEVSWKKGINKFSDWTSEEFQQYVNKFKYQRDSSMSTVSLKTNLKGNVPDSIDWRDKGAVTEVKDQGECGACWTFSATGAIEGQFKLVKNVNISLSEQNLVDCANEKNGYQSHGCNGGSMVEAFRYTRSNGIETEEAYPYEAKDGECRQKGHSNKVDSYVHVPQSEEELKLSVGIIGPISVGIEATENLQNYESGILYDETCTGKLNHGVLAIGYGTENGEDYWLIKNSWGPTWGEKGFFRLSRKDNNCGTTDAASYPILFS